MGERRTDLERARTAYATAGSGESDAQERTFMSRLQRFLRLRA
jgi:hypothetical protein